MKFLSFLLFFFYQYTALSSRAVDGHQMYSEGSVVGKASTVGIEISPTPSLIFTGGGKSAKFGVVFHITQMQQDIRTMKQRCNAAMITLCPSLVKLCPGTPEKALSVVPHPLKIALRKRAKSSIT